MPYFSEKPRVVPEFSMSSSKMHTYDLMLLSHTTVFGPRNHLTLYFRVSSLRWGWLKLGTVTRLHGLGVLGREFFIAPHVNLAILLFSLWLSQLWKTDIVGFFEREFSFTVILINLLHWVTLGTDGGTSGLFAANIRLFFLGTALTQASENQFEKKTPPAEKKNSTINFPK